MTYLVYYHRTEDGDGIPRAWGVSSNLHDARTEALAQLSAYVERGGKGRISDYTEGVRIRD